jgi:hypothetical protein
VDLLEDDNDGEYEDIEEDDASEANIKDFGTSLTIEGVYLLLPKAGIQR